MPPPVMINFFIVRLFEILKPPPVSIIAETLLLAERGIGQLLGLGLDQLVLVECLTEYKKIVRGRIDAFVPQHIVACVKGNSVPAIIVRAGYIVAFKINVVDG